jgi:tetratricopeptide (TPR) repeat protein
MSKQYGWSFVIIIMINICINHQVSANSFNQFKKNKALLEAEQFTQLENELKKILTAIESGEILDTVIADAYRAFATGDPAQKEKIDAWIASKPDSALGYLARCNYYEAVGMLHRGTNFISKTAKESLNKMRNAFIDAIPDCNKAITLDNKLSLAYTLMIRMAMVLGQDKLVQTTAKFGLSQIPDSYIIHDQYFYSFTSRWGGSIYELQNAINSRFEQLIKVDKLSPLLGFDLFFKGNEADLHENYEQALNYYRRAEKEYNINSKAYQANMLYQLKRKDEAREIYEQLIKNGTLKLTPYLKMAVFMNSKNNYNKAIDYLDKLLEIAPYNPDNLTYRGITYLWKKVPEKAKADFDKSVVYGKYNAYARYNRGKSNMYADPKEARKDLRAAYELRPDIINYAFFYGVILYEQKDCRYTGPFSVYDKLCADKKCDEKKISWVKDVLLKNISVMTSICLFLFAPIIYAGGSGWTDIVNIAELVPTARHYYELKLQVKENPSDCRNKEWFYQDYSATGSDKMFDTLLKGVTSGFKLRVYVTGRCNLNGYSEITSVSISP